MLWQVENYTGGQIVAKENLAVTCFCLNDILGKSVISSLLVLEFFDFYREHQGDCRWILCSYFVLTF